MKGVSFFIGVTAGVICAPFFAHAITAAEIRVEMAQIFEQIRILQAQLDAVTSQGTGNAPGNTNTGTSGSGSASCPIISRTLTVGSEGADVTSLQRYLASDSSVYPEAIVSGYFGSLTERAVQRWQAKYGVVSSGTPQTNGYGLVGPQTRAALSNCGAGGSSGSGSGTGSTTPVPSSVGAQMDVSPISGPAPLSTTIVATVNTSSSCEAAVYTMNFGDGTNTRAISVPQGRCSPLTQNISHTYTAEGTYPVVLSIGSYKTVVTVTVGASGGANSISNRTGAAPLTTLIQATFTTKSCVAAAGSFQTFRLNFGDGASEDLYVQNISNTPSECGRTVTKSINHTYTTAGTYTVTLDEVGPNSSGAATVLNTKTIGSVEVSTGTGNVGTGTGLSVSPTTGKTPLDVSVTFSHGVCANAESWRLNWGDGVQSEETHIRPSAGSITCSAVSSERTFTHRYITTGNHTITLFKGVGTPSTAPSVAAQTISVNP